MFRSSVYSFCISRTQLLVYAQMSSSASSGKPIIPVQGKRNVLISSALPYVNNVPHLGTIIGCVLSGDVFARYCRLRGYNTLYICGTDEYGTATETKAIEEGVTPQEVCEKYYKLHKSVYDWFNISFDYFGRTSTKQQTEIAQDIFLKIYSNGYMTTNAVEQLYCEGCARFLADRFVEGGCPFCGFADARGDQCDGCGHLINAIELKNPKCKVCAKVPTVKKSTHLFLDLPKLQAKVNEYLNTQWGGSHNVWSSNAVSISKGWLNEGLKERCITRDLKWGTPVPLQEFSDKVFYVWFDAPIGYISITACFLPNHWKEWWMNASNVEYFNFVGKDNVIFHSIIFPATLLSTGQPYTIVNHISATEYLTYENVKFSKSRGIGVFGTDAQATNIPADVWRFYLIHNRPESQDASFNWSDFALKVNTELLNDLGNFINRSLSFLYKNFDGVVGDVLPLHFDHISKGVSDELHSYVQNMEKLKIRDALKSILSISRLCNQFIQNEAPWKLMKGSEGEKKQACSVVSLMANVIAIVEPMLQPFMPDTCQEILSQLNFKSLPIADVFELKLKAGHKIGQVKPLFEKIETDVVEKYRAKFAGVDIQTKTVNVKGSANLVKKAAKSDKASHTKQNSDKQKSVSIGELKSAKITKDHLNVKIAEIEKVKSELRQIESKLIETSKKRLKELNCHYQAEIDKHVEQYYQKANREQPCSPCCGEEKS